jgi:hypothetical protein
MVFIGTPPLQETFPNQSLAFRQVGAYLGNKLIIYYIELGI